MNLNTIIEAISLHERLRMNGFGEYLYRVFLTWLWVLGTFPFAAEMICKRAFPHRWEAFDIRYPPPTRRFAEIVVLVLCIFVSSFLVWKEDRIKLIEMSPSNPSPLITRKMLSSFAARLHASGKLPPNDKRMMMAFSCDSAALKFAAEFIELLNGVGVYNIDRLVFCSRELDLNTPGLSVETNGSAEANEYAKFLVAQMRESDIPVNSPILHSQMLDHTHAAMWLVYVGK